MSSNVNNTDEPMESGTIRKRVGPQLAIALIVSYTVMIVLGLSANLLVLWGCLKSKMLSSTRNLLIMNMAVAGILLCSFTMPLTLLDQLHTNWVFGESRYLLCKSIGIIQSTCIFFSTFSVVLIAVDRFLFVIRPCSVQISTTQALGLSLFSLVCSVAISSPIFIFTDLTSYFNDDTVCEDTWETSEDRLIYATACALLQYVLPLIIVLIAYLCIVRNLQASLSRTQVFLSTDTRIRKLKRTTHINRMLIAAAVVFFVSWFPLNFYNIFVIVFPDFIQDPEILALVYSLCHLCGMSTSCSNPIIYGFLNTNYSQTFRQIWTKKEDGSQSKKKSTQRSRDT
ncbi:neuropeptide F receptor isoform X2 [Eurytemora carolleeae]|nr:neuropeptide F receptor isoform X2 [Eurytemora carolleeae]|eukprot:XP_023335731.1 neuropeptide F receptor-like isoform X2 [Eurytemora affinis]